MSVGWNEAKLQITCHNLESMRVLLPSNISTGNVNLNKKAPLSRGAIGVR
jgi:hypothetical protein